ncbi:hypothetical protein scyTo_0021774 [Scyliorhinus torazame]|uniref:Uncharacterized protein n=2 Tax=Scyliorhinus torazame TaxID=75743 RepID=A0A401Q6Q2_SCYTO|nr:hypothetical protein [Scyliorhinus torazame]
MSRGGGGDRRTQKRKAKGFPQYNQLHDHQTSNPLYQGAGTDHFRSQQIRFLTGQISQLPACVFQPLYRSQALYQQKQRSRFQPAAKNWDGNFCQQPVRSPRPPAAPAQQADKNPRPDKRLDPLFSAFQNISLGGNSRQEIVSVLGKLRPGERIPARKITKQLGVQKKVVNQILYGLLGENRVVKEGTSPPLWRLAGQTEARAEVANLEGQQGSPGNTALPLPSEVEEEESEDEDSSEDSMADRASIGDGESQKDKILSFLLEKEKATALEIAKNIGLKSARQINPTLHLFETQGDLYKEAAFPPIWSLSDRKKEVLLRKKKVHEMGEPIFGAVQGIPVAVPDVSQDDIEGVAVGEEESIGNGQAVGLPGQTNDFQTLSTSAPLLLVKGESNRANHAEANYYDSTTGNGQWASDDIPDDLNIINRVSEAGETVGLPQGVLAGKAGADQQPVLSPTDRLRACLTKNPVSGLMEYSQGSALQCEFILLAQTGPSHDPR